MGRKTAGSSRRDHLVAFRLNDEEEEELAGKMTARATTDKSGYFRTLMHEDEGPR